MEKTILRGLLIAMGVLQACRGAEGENEIKVQDVNIEEAKEDPAPPPSSSVCYLSAEGRDTSRLTLRFAGDSAYGEYSWMPWEKDGARGVLKGRLQNDTLRARYDYMIEGMQQAEDKIFVQEKGGFQELEAELVEVGGVLKPKPGAALRVRSRLKAVDCADGKEL